MSLRLRTCAFSKTKNVAGNAYWTRSVYRAVYPRRLVRGCTSVNYRAFRGKAEGLDLTRNKRRSYNNVINIGGQVSLTMKTTIEDALLAYVLPG